MIFLVIVSSCGDMGTLVSSSGSYQVRTLVNGSSLESCSFIRYGDTITPYFAVSVVNDPDLTGLLVYIQNSQGDIVGQKMRYTLQSYAYETGQTETVQPETEVSETGTTGTQDTAITGQTGQTNNTLSGETSAKSPLVPSPSANSSSAESLPADETAEASSEESPSTEPLSAKSPSAELPGQEAAAETYATQPLFDTAAVVQEDEVVVIVNSLAHDLPHFLFPKTLATGSYRLVFEALGKRETLSHTETTIFYLGTAEFNLKDIMMYLPEKSGSQLISPGTRVMLETRLDFDSGFDPYVIWYNGKHIIGEGKISEGAGTILWEAPKQAGFYSLRLEAFPFKLPRYVTGISREIALPVSSKAVHTGYFFANDSQHTPHGPLASGTAYPAQLQLIRSMSETAENADNTEETELPVPPASPQLLHWYQFRGNLSDSISGAEEYKLTPVTEQIPQWAAAGQSYGLSAGSDEAYSLAPIQLFRQEKDQGGGIFLFHISPTNEGTIFSAFFPQELSAEDGIRMNITVSGKVMTLRLNSRGASAEMSLYLDSAATEALVPVAVELYIRPYRMEAKFSLGKNQPYESTTGTIPLSGALTGEARIELGSTSGSTGSDVAGTGLFRTAKVPAVSQTASSETLRESAANASAATAEDDASSAVPQTASTETQTAQDNAVPVRTDAADQPASVSTTAAAEVSKVDTVTDHSPVTPDTVIVSTVWDELAILVSTVPLMQEEPRAAPVAEEGLTPSPAAGEIPDEVSGEVPLDTSTDKSGKLSVDTAAGTGSTGKEREQPAEKKLVNPLPEVTDTESSPQEELPMSDIQTDRELVETLSAQDLITTIEENENVLSTTTTIDGAVNTQEARVNHMENL